MKEDCLFLEPNEEHRNMYRLMAEDYNVDACIPERAGDKISEVEDYSVVVTEFDYFDQVLEEKDEATDVVLYTCRDLSEEKLPLEDSVDLVLSSPSADERKFTKATPKKIKTRIKGHTSFSDLLKDDLNLEYIDSKLMRVL